MISLLEIGKKIDEQDKIRRDQIKHHPKYEPGFEEENRDDSKVWQEDEKLRGLFK